VVETLALLERIAFLRQKFGFHFDNLTALRIKDLVGYVSEKMRMAREVSLGKIGARVKALKNTGFGAAPKKLAAAPYLQDLNDEAAYRFVPRPFPGRITVFRPQKQYDFMPDPQLGWGELVSGGLEVVELPVNPHAMLLDPHTKILASELKTRLSKRIIQ